MASKKQTGASASPGKANGAGFELVSVRASCSVTAPSVAAWEGVLAAIPFKRAVLDPGEAFADASLLLLDDPWKADGQVARITVHDGSSHSRIPKAKRKGAVEAHWTFLLEPAPHFPPPSDLAVLSRQAGGRAGALGALAAHWPGSRQLTLLMSASYMVDGKHYGLDPQLEKAKPKPLKGPSGLKLTSRGFIWEVAAKGLEGLLTAEYPEGSKPFLVTWTGSTKLELTTDFFGTLEGAIWETLSRFLAPKRQARKPAAR